jgi:putative NADPH-quinone reductase
VGLLRARHALVFNTSNTPAEREAAVFGDPLEAVWRRCVFELCGVSRFTRRMFGPMSGSSDGQRARWRAEAQALVHAAASD